MQLIFRVFWKDTRLNTTNISDDKQYMLLDNKLLSELWVPDAYFHMVQEYESPELLAPPVSLRFYKAENRIRASQL